MNFNVSTRNADQAVIVDLAGHFISGEPVRIFQQRIQEQYEQGKRNFVINLAEASFVDSSGIGALIQLWTTLRKLRETSGVGGMVLLNVTPRMRDLLIITKLSTTFFAYDDETAAVAAVMS